MKFPNKIFDFRLSKSHSLFTSMWKFQDWKKPRICDFFSSISTSARKSSQLVCIYMLYICLPSLCGARPKMFTALTMVLFRSKERFSDFFYFSFYYCSFVFIPVGMGDFYAWANFRRSVFPIGSAFMALIFGIRFSVKSIFLCMEIRGIWAIDFFAVCEVGGLIFYVQNVL